MPFGPAGLFWIGVVPAVTAALVTLVCSHLAVRPTAGWALSVGSGLSAGMVGQGVRVGWHTALEKLLHPHVAIDWLPWLVLIATGISVLASYAPRPWQRYVVGLACLLVIAMPVRLLASSVYVTTRWSAAEKLGVLVLWSAVFASWWFTLALGRRNAQPLIRCGLLALVTLGIALTVALSGAITLGELGGIAVATLLGTALAAIVFQYLDQGPSGAAGPLAVMVGGLIFLAHFFSELSATNVALLSISLWAAAGWLPEGWPEHPAGRAAVRALLALVPLAVALATAIAASSADPYA